MYTEIPPATCSHVMERVLTTVPHLANEDPDEPQTSSDENHEEVKYERKESVTPADLNKHNWFPSKEEDMVSA